MLKATPARSSIVVARVALDKASLLKSLAARPAAARRFNTVLAGGQAPPSFAFAARARFRARAAPAPRRFVPPRSVDNI
jgi:hypothetical protein